MTRRILFVDQSGRLGGAELSLLDIAAHFGSQSRVVLLADGPFRSSLEAKDVPVTVLAAPKNLGGVRREASAGLKPLMVLPALLRSALKVAGVARDYDVIYANTQKAVIIGALASKLARRPLIWHLRDILSEDHFSRTLIRLAIALSNTCVKLVIANSQATAEAFVRSGGRPDRVIVVLNGVDSAPFVQISEEEVGRLRRAFGLGTAPLIGVFSRIAPWKGQDVLIDALPLLPSVHALIVGEPLFGEDAYLGSLRTKSISLGVDARVHFLGFRNDVPALMRMVDVVVHTSRAPEPFGRVLVEGMLAGRPVVASLGGGTSEIIENAVTGVLVPPGNPAVLASAISKLLNSKCEAERIARAGRDMACKKFSRERMIFDIEQAIVSALS